MRFILRGNNTHTDKQGDNKNDLIITLKKD